MADNDSYKVLVPELSVPRAIGELHDIYGNPTGYSHVNETFFEGDVLSSDQVSPVVQEQVEAGEFEGRLEKVSDEPGPNLAARFTEVSDDYDDLSVEDVRALFRFLPSQSIVQIQTYEREFGQNRPEIVEYDIGRGEGFLDRIQGTIGSERQDPTEGPTAEVATREVGEDEVEFSDSFIGDGTPDREPGDTAKLEEQSEKPKRSSRSSKKQQDEGEKRESAESTKE